MDRGDVIMPVAENVPVAEVEFDESKSPSPPQEMTVTPRQANKTNEKNLFIDESKQSFRLTGRRNVLLITLILTKTESNGLYLFDKESALDLSRKTSSVSDKKSFLALSPETVYGFGDYSLRRVAEGVLTRFFRKYRLASV
jgi:hypothetical protein